MKKIKENSICNSQGLLRCNSSKKTLLISLCHPKPGPLQMPFLSEWLQHTHLCKSAAYESAMTLPSPSAHSIIHQSPNPISFNS